MRSSFHARACLSAVVLGMVLFVLQQQVRPGRQRFTRGNGSGPQRRCYTGAKMTLVNEANGAQLNFTTDAAGEYNFRNLTPGVYDLTVTASSFETFVRKGIELAVNQDARIPVSLTLGTQAKRSPSPQTPRSSTTKTLLEALVSPPKRYKTFPWSSGAPRSSVTVECFRPARPPGAAAMPTIPVPMGASSPATRRWWMAPRRRKVSRINPGW